jgi:hypothetical protein
MPIAVQVIDQRKAWVVAVVVDAGNVHQVIESQLFLGRGAHFR